MAAPKTLSGWNRLAERRLAHFIRRAQRIPAIRKIGPKKRWKAAAKIVSAAAMTQLNKQYRGKNYATDILSFQPPRVFRADGYLGELVICLPTLKRQARELKHPTALELDVLLAHGVIHLLGLDHEKSRKQATEMSRLEALLLPETPGLIRRLDPT